MESLPNRARIGLVVPPNNTVNEAEWKRWLPSDVSLHATRFRFDPAAREGAAWVALCSGLATACALLAEAEVAAIAFGCTAPSAISPRHHVERMMTEASGCPAVTAAAAVVDALEAVAARRVVLASPFSAELTEHEAAFLRTEGIDVVSTTALGHGTYAPGRKLAIHLIAPEEVRDIARAADHPDADALVLSGTNLSTLDVIEDIEQSIGKPVITSNQATLWSALRKAGINDRLPIGRLFTTR